MQNVMNDRVVRDAVTRPVTDEMSEFISVSFSALPSLLPVVVARLCKAEATSISAPAR